MAKVAETATRARVNRHVTWHARVSVREVDDDTVQLLKCHGYDVEGSGVNSR